MAAAARPEVLRQALASLGAYPRTHFGIIANHGLSGEAVVALEEELDGEFSPDRALEPM